MVQCWNRREIATNISYFVIQYPYISG